MMTEFLVSITSKHYLKSGEVEEKTHCAQVPTESLKDAWAWFDDFMLQEQANAEEQS